MNTKPRLYIPEDGFNEFDLEACSIRAPEFLVGQHVEFEDGDRIKTGVVTKIYLRTVNWPHWQYSIDNSDRVYMSCEMNSGDPDNGPCGDGVSSYQELMTAMCRQMNVDIAYTRNEAAITQYERLCGLIKDRSPEMDEAMDNLWDHLARSSIALYQITEVEDD